MTDSEITSLVYETAREVVAQAVEVFVHAPQRAYLNTEQAAHYLALSREQLEIWRCQDAGPPYIKLARAVRYSRADLDAWMAARRQTHTGQNA